MTQHLKSCRFGKGTGRDGDPVLSPGVPEQGGTAIAAEPSVDVGGLVRQRAEPLQAAILDELQIINSGKGIGGSVAVEKTSLRAVTAGNAREFAVDLVAHGSAKTTAGVFRVRHRETFLRIQGSRSNIQEKRTYRNLAP